MSAATEDAQASSAKREKPEPVTLRGGCHCGAVRFSVDSAATIFRISCHCTICQRKSGSAFLPVVGFKAGALKIESGEDRLVKFATSERMERYSCSACNAGVFNRSLLPDRPFDDVPLAAFDRERDGGKDGPIAHFDLLAPTGHMFYGSRVVGDAFKGDGLPKWSGVPGGKPDMS